MENNYNLTDFPAESWLQVNNCGIEGSTDTGYNLLRPDGRSDYYMFYIANGWIQIELNGEMIRIDQQNCVLFPPRVRQLIYYPPDPELSIYYVHFTGGTADEAMHTLASQGIQVYSVADATMTEVLFRQLYQSVLLARMECGQTQVTDLKVNGLLLQLIASVVQNGSAKARPDHDAIISAMLFISEHFREEIDLEQCASNAHLSLSRFAHLFREKIGTSPHRFILSLRMDEARELLSYSSMTVNEIARNVGFPDASYFSRIFRKYTGYMPTEYRSKH